MPRLRLHSHESGVHEAHHVANGVHRADRILTHAIIVEKAHAVRLVHIVRYRVGVVGEACSKLLVGIGALGYILDEARNFTVVLVLPGICRAPVAAEIALKLLHVLACSVFGILLQASVDGGVDFQSVAIEVVAIVAAPLAQLGSHSLTEVESLTIVGILHAEIEVDRQCAD